VPSVCLRDAYEAYSKAGGNRGISERVLAHFDGVEIEALDRAAQREAGEKLFPGFGEHIWDDEVFGPITEVLKFWRRQEAKKAPGRYANPWGINQGYRGSRDGIDPPPFCPGMRVRHLIGQSCLLEPYLKWAHEIPSGPYPFEIQAEIEATQIRPAVSAAWDEREAAEQNAARLARRERTLNGPFYRVAAPHIRQQDEYESSMKWQRHNLPLGPIDTITAYQWQRWRQGYDITPQKRGRPRKETPKMGRPNGRPIKFGLKMSDAERARRSYARKKLSDLARSNLEARMQITFNMVCAHLAYQHGEQETRI
jgi:hypothetical protein